jgi:hypothetical protein
MAGARDPAAHPPRRIAKYFAGSPFEGAQIAAAEGPKSKRLALFDELRAQRFASVPAGLSREDLQWLAEFQLHRLEAEREERRMHFGALVLVTVLFFLVFPQLIAQQFANLGLSLVALLLLVLIVPYVLVYFGYENRVRAMALEHLRLLEAIALSDEREACGALPMQDLRKGR